MISKNQIKHIKSLHLKKNKDAQELFLAEGKKTVAEILEQRPSILKELYATQEFINENVKSLESQNIKYHAITINELEQISQLSNPNDAVAVCEYIKETNSQTDFEHNISFYLDDIRDPGNLGTIIRICSWFGIKDLFCSNNTVDLYNPKCIQASMGSFLRVAVHYIDLNVLISEQKIKHIYATVLNGENIYKNQLKGGLVIIGNEANGISKNALELSNKQLTIPSKNSDTESLNAAIATSIIASEYYRQSL